MLGLGIHLIFGCLIIMTKSMIATQIFIFFMGLAMPPRVFVGYIYAMEFLPSEKTKVLTSFILSNDGLVLAVTSFYLLYIDKNCRIFFGLSLIGIGVAIVMLYRMPESPEYLVS